VIKRPSTVVAELKVLFDEQRAVMSKCGINKRHFKGINHRFNEYEKWALNYAGSKVLFASLHFKVMWNENWFHVYSKKRPHLMHNTATQFIDAVLRRIGTDNGWLKQ